MTLEESLRDLAREHLPLKRISNGAELCGALEELADQARDLEDERDRLRALGRGVLDYLAEWPDDAPVISFRKALAGGAGT